MVICSLEVDDFIKELLEIHSPEDKVFFDQLRKIIQFVVKDSTRSLEPVWKIQDRWTNGAYVVQLHQIVISCVKEFTLQHVNYLISNIQVHISHITGCCALISKICLSLFSCLGTLELGRCDPTLRIVEFYSYFGQ